MEATEMPRCNHSKMVSFKAYMLALILSAVSLTAARVTGPLLDRRNNVLNDGSSQKSGTVVNGLNWQATGALSQGPCPGSTAHPIQIPGDNCYQLSLSSDPTKELDQGHLDSPRQRIEFLTTPKMADGTSFKFKWRYYLSSNTGTSNKFFHLMQLFSDADGGPVVTLDAVSNTIAIKDNERTCGTDVTCPSIPLSTFTDITTRHEVSGVVGPNGSIDYRLLYVNGSQLFRYQASGYMGTGGVYVKFGTYRAAFSGMTAVNAAIGLDAFVNPS